VKITKFDPGNPTGKQDNSAPNKPEIPDANGEYSLWIPGYVAAGFDAAQIAAEIAAHDPNGERPDLDDLYRRQIKSSAGVTIPASKALIKTARATRHTDQEPSGNSADDAANRNRGKWVNRIRAVGGRTMRDTSNPEIEYLVIPIGRTSFAQVLAELSEVSEDAPVDSLAPKVDRTGEPGIGERIAWIAKLRKTTKDGTPVPDSIPTEVRDIPRPICAILHDGAHHHLVFTKDDVAVTITPDDERLGTWAAKAGAKSPTGRRMTEITLEAFRVLAEETPVYRTEPRLDSQGKLILMPRGVMPPGWRDLAPDCDRENAFTRWKEAAGIVERSPGGIAAHVWGAVADSYYVRYNHRQSHAIDLHGPDTNTGKSSLIRSIGAMIGDPIQTARPFDLASAISATSYAGQIGYGVLPLDESQLFKGDADERARTVFRLCETGVRTRSLSDGSGVTGTRPFGGLMLLTGNLRFVSAETVDKIFPGLSRRYLPIYVDREHPVFRDTVDATDVSDLTRSAHGWFIPLLTESVTNDEYMGWVREIWLTLTTDYPDENPEVLRIFAGHLAGCRAIDGLFGTSFESSARESVDTQARIVTHQAANVGQVFIEAIRDHAQVNRGMWHSEAEYYTFRTRDNGTDLMGTDRQPVGVVFNNDKGFMILGNPTLVKLCTQFGIADPDAVITSLDRGELLKVTDSERARKKSTTQTWAVSENGRNRIPARGYYVLASPDHGSDDADGPTAPGGGPESDQAAPEPGPAANQAAALASDQAAAPAEPFATLTAYKRPEWMPEEMRKDKQGNYSGVVTAFNELWESQQKRGAQIHNHPYPDDDSIPEPLRLIKRGMGTGVHEGAHSYLNSDTPGGMPVTILDRNAAFLAAIGTAILPIDGLTPFDGEGDEKLTGIYRIQSWPELLRPGPHPWGTRKTLLLKRDLWVTRPTLDLGRDMADAGIMENPRVISSLLGRRLRENRPATARLERLYGQLNDARTAGLMAGDSDAVGFIKAMYSVGISTMGESGSNTRIWRPELPPIIRAASFTNNYRLARKLQTAGLAIVALTHNDEIHVAATPETVFAATDGAGKPVVKRGLALNEIKIKGGYVTGIDGSPAPDSEWSNDHA
jgi:hypothetical protein